MGKVSELSMIVDELKKCGQVLIGISEGLADMFSGSAEEEKQTAKKSAGKKKAAEESRPEVPEKKALTLEDVRAVCADKSRKGYTAEVKAVLTKHGAEKLSEVDPAEYKALLAEVEVLGNAG
ncbi:DNA ligase [Agathobaculum sp. NTUH-O15-33]|uniref:DNA ligase n=1 Tax=Agathobaculum sp. NTUH-O15-33 TaxID=3079302 RepID=UPI0029584455|nr:DNA ligase [Agathobaculum sp. NTUH-O15-33]WNX86006.1 DNA ligase [Agathobaculum sp. NTUH-O15-33]